MKPISFIAAFVLFPMVTFGEGLEVKDLQRDKPVDFQSEILPILRSNCLACHNRTRTKGEVILETPADIRKEIGLDTRAASRVKEAMLKGELDEAMRHLPESLVDRYAVTGTPAECALIIAEHRPHFDLFLLPMNGETECEAHIRSSAAILDQASCAGD